MDITYLGHSCFLLHINGTRILIDPFITYNPLANQINKEEIEADFILLTHGHQDHVADAEYFAQKTNATVVAIFEICEWYKAIEVQNTIPMNIGGKVNLSFGTVKMVTAVHSSLLPDGTYGGNPAGFVITAGEQTIYFAGDTALTYDMKLIAEQYRVDVAFLPIGGQLTMDLADALLAAKWVGTNRVIGMHYDTFSFIKINHTEAVETARQAGIGLTLIPISETINI